jgi:hypothetical protein
VRSLMRGRESVVRLETSPVDGKESVINVDRLEQFTDVLREIT